MNVSRTSSSLLVAWVLAACGQTISSPDAPPCVGDGCAAPPGATDAPGAETTDTADVPGNDDVDDTDTARSCTATQCVDGDGFCDVGFCTPCVRDEDCGDAPANTTPDDNEPNDPADPTGPTDRGDLPPCLENECVEGDGFCDIDFCSTCPVDGDCTSTDPNDPNDSSDPNDSNDSNDPACDSDACCLPNECIAGDGFCDEDWCDDCEDDPDCQDDANERCDIEEDDDCCLPDECIAGDGFCDEDRCEGCEVDADCE